MWLCVALYVGVFVCLCVLCVCAYVRVLCLRRVAASTSRRTDGLCQATNWWSYTTNFASTSTAHRTMNDLFALLPIAGKLFDVLFIASAYLQGQLALGTLSLLLVLAGSILAATHMATCGGRPDAPLLCVLPPIPPAPPPLPPVVRTADPRTRTRADRHFTGFAALVESITEGLQRPMHLQELDEAAPPPVGEAFQVRACRYAFPHAVLFRCALPRVEICISACVVLWGGVPGVCGAPVRADGGGAHGCAEGAVRAGCGPPAVRESPRRAQAMYMTAVRFNVPNIYLASLVVSLVALVVGLGRADAAVLRHACLLRASPPPVPDEDPAFRARVGPPRAAPARRSRGARVTPAPADGAAAASVSPLMSGAAEAPPSREDDDERWVAEGPLAHGGGAAYEECIAAYVRGRRRLPGAGALPPEIVRCGGGVPPRGVDVRRAIGAVGVYRALDLSTRLLALMVLAFHLPAAGTGGIVAAEAAATAGFRMWAGAQAATATANAIGSRPLHRRPRREGPGATLLAAAAAAARAVAACPARVARSMWGTLTFDSAALVRAMRERRARHVGSGDRAPPRDPEDDARGMFAAGAAAAAASVAMQDRWARFVAAVGGAPVVDSGVAAVFSAFGALSLAPGVFARTLTPSQRLLEHVAAGALFATAPWPVLAAAGARAAFHCIAFVVAAARADPAQGWLVRAPFALGALLVVSLCTFLVARASVSRVLRAPPLELSFADAARIAGPALAEPTPAVEARADALAGGGDAGDGGDDGSDGDADDELLGTRRVRRGAGARRPDDGDGDDSEGGDGASEDEDADNREAAGGSDLTATVAARRAVAVTVRAQRRRSSALLGIDTSEATHRRRSRASSSGRGRSSLADPPAA